MMVSRVRGRFTTFSGELVTARSCWIVGHRTIDLTSPHTGNDA